MRPFVGAHLGVVANGTPDEIRNDPKVRAAYLEQLEAVEAVGDVAFAAERSCGDGPSPS